MVNADRRPVHGRRSRRAIRSAQRRSGRTTGAATDRSRLGTQSRRGLNRERPDRLSLSDPTLASARSLTGAGYDRSMSVARIVVRSPRYPGQRRLFKDDIFVDGKQVARIRPGKSTRFDVEAGDHTSRLERSPEAHVQLAPGQEARFGYAPDLDGREERRQTLRAGARGLDGCIRKSSRRDGSCSSANRDRHCGAPGPSRDGCCVSRRATLGRVCRVLSAYKNVRVASRSERPG